MNKPRKLNTKQKTAYDSLTRKQKAFVDHILNNPKDSNVQAALATYGSPDNPPTYNSANQIARDNLQNPTILSILKDASTTAQHKVVELISSENESISLSASKDVLDRVHGKAISRNVSTTVSVEDIIDQLH